MRKAAISETVYCATLPEVAGDSGHYYEDCREREPSRSFPTLRSWEALGRLMQADEMDQAAWSILVEEWARSRTRDEIFGFAVAG